MGRTAYDFWLYGRISLQTYVKRFELPIPALRNRELEGTFTLPAVDDRFTKNYGNRNLNVRHERGRCLETIHSIGYEIEHLVRPWTKANISSTPDPSDALIYSETANYTLPQTLPPFYIESPSDLDNMFSWLVLAIITATRAMHRIDRRWMTFLCESPVHADLDQNIFRYVVWKNQGEKLTAVRDSVVLAYETPYTLTQREMQEFVECGAFPVYDNLNVENLQSKHRLWGKIWDTCQTETCDWFILTNYTHWVFGAFSSGGRAAFVSSVIPYQNDAKSPTILEWILFWLSSAGGKGYKIPTIAEPVTTMWDFHNLQMPVKQAPTGSSLYSGI
ncbi:hypothetical protein CPC08DRAFT_760073 [Agrocybe pediades]|nr:hypothetical protein CPC08DRAFT_760073 [Agrocybe pediades]